MWGSDKVCFLGETTQPCGVEPHRAEQSRDTQTQRGFSWALLSWHCFHPKTGDHVTVEPGYVLQQDFSKITLFKYFILIFFLSRGPKPLNQRQFCFPSCQQYFGYFKNVGQG